MKLTFTEWKVLVNAEIERRVGLGADDLPDWDYYRSWSDGDSPKSAATQAIKASHDF